MTNGSIDTAIAPTLEEVDAPSLLASACEHYLANHGPVAGLWSV